MDHIRTFDRQAAAIIGRVPAWTHKPLDILGYATPPIAWFTALLLYALLFQRTDQNALETTFIVLVLLPLGSLIKFLFKRKRPPTIYADKMKIKSYSFPSSHAYSAALGGTYVASLLLGSGLVLLAIGCYVLVAIIGTSRVILGAHYPSDVMAGWIVGFGLSAMVAFIV